VGNVEVSRRGLTSGCMTWWAAGSSDKIQLGLSVGIWSKNWTRDLPNMKYKNK